MSTVSTERAHTAGEAALRYLRIGEIRPLGWVADQLRQDLGGFAGQFRQLCAEAASDIFVTGRVSGNDAGNRHWWNGETEGKWIDGLVRVAHVLGDPAAIQHVTAYLDRLCDHQDSDGYLGIYQAQWRQGGGRCAGDLWTQTFPLLALLAQHEATGQDRYLQGAAAAADETITRHGPGAPDGPFTGTAEDSMVLGHNLMVTEPLLWLFELTGETRYRDFAAWCYDSYSQAELGWPESDGQLARISDPSLPFIGHGAHTCAQLRVPLLLFAATGDPRYQRAYQTGYAKIAACLGVSGACKSDECIGSPDNPGAPLPGAGYEYCATTELLHSLHHALRVTGDLRYADQAERLLLNAAQASRQHDGRSIAYLGADNQYLAAKSAGGRWDYSPTHDDIAVCCNPSAARCLAHHISRSVLRTPGHGLLITQYTPCRVSTTVRGVPVTITIDGTFPFSDDLTVTVRASRPVRFPLTFRIPAWSHALSITAPPPARARPHADSITIEHDWDTADTLALHLAARIDLIEAIDGQVAISRGPLVFALNIPADARPTRSYPLTGYADIDFTPRADAQWDYTLQTSPAGPGRFAAVTHAGPVTQPAFPWADPPLRIRVEALSPQPSENYYTGMSRQLELIPLGSTTLRRTCFPRVLRAEPDAAPGAHPARDSRP